MLQFDISDVTKEGVGVSCQLMVGQSSVPHYQQLEEFTARLAPGEVRVSLSALQPFADSHHSVISVLGFLGEPDSSAALLGSVQRPRA